MPDYGNKAVFQLFRGGKYDMHLWILYDDLKTGIVQLTSILKKSSVSIPLTNSFIKGTDPIESLQINRTSTREAHLDYVNDQLNIYLHQETIEMLIKGLKDASKSGEFFPAEVVEMFTNFGYDIMLYATVGY